jgi:hypothetical protein
MIPDDLESRVNAAYHSALALVTILKNSPEDPEGYVWLRLAAVDASRHALGVARWWIGQSPSWDPQAVSALEGIVRLGQRLTCLAAAAAQVLWNAKDFQSAVADNWSAVQQAVKDHYKPVANGILEAALRHEVRETCGREPFYLPRLLPSDAGWLDQELTALELVLPGPKPSCPVTLTKNQTKILAALQEAALRQAGSQRLFQVDLAAATDLDPKTVRTHLAELRKLGLVTRPKGDRGGETITDLGIEYLPKKSMLS